MKYMKERLWSRLSDDQAFQAWQMALIFIPNLAKCPNIDDVEDIYYSKFHVLGLELIESVFKPKPSEKIQNILDK